MKATITIQDTEDGCVRLSVDFNEPLGAENGSLAVEVTMSCMDLIQNIIHVRQSRAPATGAPLPGELQ